MGYEVLFFFIYIFSYVLVWNLDIPCGHSLIIRPVYPHSLIIRPVYPLFFLLNKNIYDECFSKWLTHVRH